MPNSQFYVLDRFNRIMPDGTIIHHSFRRRNCKLTVVGAEYHSVSDGGFHEYAILHFGDGTSTKEFELKDCDRRYLPKIARAFRRWARGNGL